MSDKEINNELEDSKKTQVEDNEINENTTENSEIEKEDENNEESASEKYSELHDKFIRLYSDFENYKKRSNKEKLELISTASSGVLKDLLPILDDFERAIINNENLEDIEAIKEGFKLIYSKFKGTLESKGLKAMESIGSDFDSEIHEAIANVPAQSEEFKGKVIDHVEKGYYLNEKVIRFAKVVVGQ